MNDLIEQVKGMANTDSDTAKSIIGTVIGFVKGKLPDSISSQVDGYVNEENSGEMLDKAKGALGGMFGS